MPERQDKTAVPYGLEILNNELADTNLFDLLYGNHGLIAIFPVLSGKQNKQEALLGHPKVKYFDLSDYYVNIATFLTQIRFEEDSR